MFHASCFMDLAQLFKPIEKIVGMEITEKYILAVLLARDKKGVIQMIKKTAALGEGAVARGIVQNEAALADALKAFVRKNKDIFWSKYIILAIPSAFVFTDVMKFPSVRQEQIGESLALNFNSKTLFPTAPGEIYYDWQSVNSHSSMRQDALVSFAQKKHIDAFVSACEQAGLEPLAFEIPQAAALRAITNFKEKTGLIVRVLDEGIEFSVAVQGELKFSRFAHRLASLREIEKLTAFVKDETMKTIHFFQIEYPETPVTALVALSAFAQSEIGAALTKELGVPSEPVRLAHPVELPDSHIAAFGSALRGLIPREEDALISLMPVGTEETYRSRRLRAYISLWSDIINTTAFLFAVLFAAALFFLTRIRTNLDAQTARKGSAQTAYAQITELEESARAFNAAIRQIAGIQENAFSWSDLFSRITPSLAQANITVTGITVSDIGKTVSVRFTAATREAATAFKKSLEASGLYEKVEMPFLSVTQREQISTTVSLKPL